MGLRVRTQASYQETGGKLSLTSANLCGNVHLEPTGFPWMAWCLLKADEIIASYQLPTVFRIRIHSIQIRIRPVKTNADPEQIQA
jgi:hypothetical protein